MALECYSGWLSPKSPFGKCPVAFRDGRISFSATVLGFFVQPCFAEHMAIQDRESWGGGMGVVST